MMKWVNWVERACENAALQYAAWTSADSRPHSWGHVLQAEALGLAENEEGGELAAPPMKSSCGANRSAISDFSSSSGGGSPLLFVGIVKGREGVSAR